MQITCVAPWFNIFLNLGDGFKQIFLMFTPKIGEDGPILTNN